MSKLNLLFRLKTRRLKTQSGAYYRLETVRGRHELRARVVHLNCAELAFADPVNKPLDVKAQEVLALQGHSKEVFACSWSSATGQLATGSADGGARLWLVPASLPGGPDADTPAVLRASTLLDHTSDAASAASIKAPADSGSDITSVAWSADGGTLATACQDGVIRLWNSDGSFQRLLEGHTGSVFTLKWAPGDKLLLSAGEDGIAMVWNAAVGSAVGRTACHTAPVLDVAWRCGEVFASAGTDYAVCVSKVDVGGGAGGGSAVSTLATYKGHTNEVNAVAWSSNGALLASASDDGTAKVWSFTEGAATASAAGEGGAAAGGGEGAAENGLLHDLTSHTAEVYCLAWAPHTGMDSGGVPGAASASHRMATASMDCSVRLWDGSTGACLATLQAHSGMVYTVQFSPDGLLLASGGFDKAVHVWDAAQGSLVRSHRASGGVYSVQWRGDGMRLAATLTDFSTHIFDVRE